MGGLNAKGYGVTKVIGFLVAGLVGALLGVTVSLATVATQRPDAKAENTEVPADVQQAGGDLGKVILVYGNR